jgi:hypothetical protein
MDSEAGAEAMQYDGVHPDTLAVYVEGRHARTHSVPWASFTVKWRRDNGFGHEPLLALANGRRSRPSSTSVLLARGDWALLPSRWNHAGQAHAAFSRDDGALEDTDPLTRRPRSRQ